MMQPLKQAAVLVPLHRDGHGQLHITLIERSRTLPSHPGQIALPGGTYDAARDPDLLSTALREAEEEIGLLASAVTILGALPERRTYTSRFSILPFVAQICAQQRLVADPREVAAILTVDLARFRGQPRETIRREYQGQPVELPCVRIGAHPVWGATLDIIDNLLASPLLDLA
jgi:8-oxo-dGTP pyrophosphatase MutT (NUDIX family)